MEMIIKYYLLQILINLESFKNISKTTGIKITKIGKIISGKNKSKINY